MPIRTAQIDVDAARRQLTALDDEQVRHVFACVPEAPGARGGVRHVVGTLESVRDRLEAEQSAGCGVFVTVNAMRGRRRLKAEVSRVRALWIERDGPGAELPLTPSLVVATSPGRQHEYLLTTPGDPLDAPEATRINRAIAQQFGGDRQAADLARVLRLAGSWHLKSEPHLARLLSDRGTRYSAAALRAAFPAPNTAPRAQRTPTPLASPRYLAAAVAGICADLAAAVEGMRNDTLNRAAFRLASLGFDLAEIESTLTPIALSIGLGEKETAATIRSGTIAGGKLSCPTLRKAR